MLGKWSVQKPLFDVGNIFDLKLNPKSFHAQLAPRGPRLFTDADFAAFYKHKRGRPSVPPSLLALATLLQHEAGVSDEEAINKMAYDLRWCAVLGREAGQPLCPKSTFQLFRAHLFLHPEVNTIFEASLSEAKRSDLLKGEALKIALDTKPIWGLDTKPIWGLDTKPIWGLDTKPIRGRGAVQDTFNLVAAGIRQLGRVLAQQEAKKPDAFFAEQGLERYTKDSVKGSADLDWSDDAAKNALLTHVVHDARRLLALATSSLPEVRDAARLLEQLLLQDVEVKEPRRANRPPLRKARPKAGCLRRVIPTCATAGRALPSASTGTRPMWPWIRTANSAWPSRCLPAMRAMPRERLPSWSRPKPIPH